MVQEIKTKKDANVVEKISCLIPELGKEIIGVLDHCYNEGIYGKQYVIKTPEVVDGKVVVKDHFLPTNRILNSELDALPQGVCVSIKLVEKGVYTPEKKTANKYDVHAVRREVYNELFMSLLE